MRFQTSVLARKRTRRDRDSGKIEEAPIRVKTARNIVGGHFRALIGWSRRIYRLPLTACGGRSRRSRRRVLEARAGADPKSEATNRNRATY